MAKYELRRFVLGPLDTNTYLLLGPSGNALLVDAPPNSFSKLLYYIDRNLIRLTYILITHAHFDHASEAQLIKEVSNAKIVMNVKEFDMFRESRRVATYFNVKWVDPEPDVLIDGDKELDLGWISVYAIETPGHTPGSTCYYIKELNIIFTGDVLFKGTIGRTDFYLGDPKAMRESLRKLIRLVPPKTRVLPGHGDETTMEYELTYNPYLIDLRGD